MNKPPSDKLSPLAQPCESLEARVETAIRKLWVRPLVTEPQAPPRGKPIRFEELFACEC